jgi:hypothetical protein
MFVLLSIVFFCIMLSAIMLCHYAAYRYAESRNIEFHALCRCVDTNYGVMECYYLIVIMLGVIMSVSLY